MNRHVDPFVDDTAANWLWTMFFAVATIAFVILTFAGIVVLVRRARHLKSMPRNRRRPALIRDWHDLRKPRGAIVILAWLALIPILVFGWENSGRPYLAIAVLGGIGAYGFHATSPSRRYIGTRIPRWIWIALWILFVGVAIAAPAAMAYRAWNTASAHVSTDPTTKPRPTPSKPRPADTATPGPTSPADWLADVNAGRGFIDLRDGRRFLIARDICIAVTGEHVEVQSFQGTGFRPWATYPDGSLRPVTAKQIVPCSGTDRVGPTDLVMKTDIAHLAWKSDGSPHSIKVTDRLRISAYLVQVTDKGRAPLDPRVIWYWGFVDGESLYTYVDVVDDRFPWQPCPAAELCHR